MTKKEITCGRCKDTKPIIEFSIKPNGDRYKFCKDCRVKMRKYPNKKEQDDNTSSEQDEPGLDQNNNLQEPIPESNNNLKDETPELNNNLKEETPEPNIIKNESKDNEPGTTEHIPKIEEIKYPKKKDFNIPKMKCLENTFSKISGKSSNNNILDLFTFESITFFGIGIIVGAILKKQ